MRRTSFWVALGLGAVAGGVVGLLYAPQSGTVMRRRLRRSVEDLGETLEDAGDYLKEQAERLSKEAQRLLSVSKEQIDSAVDTATGYVKTANKAVNKLM